MVLSDYTAVGAVVDDSEVDDDDDYDDDDYDDDDDDDDDDDHVSADNNMQMETILKNGRAS